MIETIKEDYRQGIKSTIEQLTYNLRENLLTLIEVMTSECKVKPAFDLLFSVLEIKNTRSNPYNMVILKEKNTLQDVLRSPE